MLPPEVDEPARLQVKELVEAVEPTLLQEQHGLELIEPRLGRADLAFQRVDLLGHDLDLRGEHTLALARPLDLRFEVVDASVQDPLALLDVLTRCRGRSEQCARQGEGNDNPCHSQTVSLGGRPSLPDAAGA
jgi:hypothetical protein